ncbi:MAG: TauD/TfdA dioxygenase family protein [Lautropia sp.]
MPFEIVPNPVPVGAELRGLDASRPLADADLAQLRGALDDYGVVYLRDQPLTPDQYVAFGARLGTLRRHVFDQFLLASQPSILVISNIVENGRQIGVADAGQYWHTDGAFEAEPHIYSVLNAQEIPHDDGGKPLGSTMFVSTVHAFATLDDEIRARLRGRRGFHSLIAQYEKKQHTGKGAHVPLTDEQKARNPDRFHPLVWPHPRSGRECLYVNEGTTFGIEGMPDDEALPLIARLCEHIVRPEVIYHHRWQVGDLLIWDNYSTQHKVNFDYGPQRRRKMHRLTVA